MDLGAPGVHLGVLGMDVRALGVSLGCLGMDLGARGFDVRALVMDLGALRVDFDLHYTEATRPPTAELIAQHGFLAEVGGIRDRRPGAWGLGTRASPFFIVF